MRSLLTNDEPVAIRANAPTRVRSEIEVEDHEGQVRDVRVTLDLDHTWTADLEITLEGPKGQRAVLVSGQGGRGDDFRDTHFDDAATDSISGARAPFRGVFRPETPLNVFDGSDANGTWTLWIDDRAALDGGRLNRWTLGIETCCFEFESRQRVRIGSGDPSTVRSTLDVRGLGGLLVQDVEVTVDLDHTWDSDLTLALIAPDGREVVLVDRRGGSRDDFQGTTFTDAARNRIGSGRAPFSGRYRPEEPLSVLRGALADGAWVLEVRDQARRDGGWLERFRLKLHAEQPERPRGSQFAIDVRVLGGLTPSQRSVFQLAAARWAEVIVGDLPQATVDGEAIDDVRIDAEGVAIDGPGRVLGQAGPERLRRGSQLPVTGRMSFDTADLADLERSGGLIDVIVHEMGHVLGIGTLWNSMGLLRGAGTANPRFVGPRTMREYGSLIGSGVPTPVPVANTGGPGTRDGHWRESVFGTELMTGFLDGADSPLSRMTVASLADMGYAVDLDSADAYQLPTALELAALGIHADDRRVCCSQVSPRAVELPASACAPHPERATRRGGPKRASKKRAEASAKTGRKSSRKTSKGRARRS